MAAGGPKWWDRPVERIGRRTEPLNHWTKTSRAGGGAQSIPSNVLAIGVYEHDQMAAEAVRRRLRFQSESVWLPSKSQPGIRLATLGTVAGILTPGCFPDCKQKVPRPLLHVVRIAQTHPLASSADNERGQ